MESIYKSAAGESAVMALYDALLARWPVPYETLTVPTRHGDTFVMACGSPSAPPMILLHGAGTNSAIWAGDVVEYSRKYRVYLLDLLGEPGKSSPNRPAWDSPAYAEWLEDVLNALRVQKAIFIGLSQGGWSALKFAVTQPERVDKLILLTPGGIVPDKATFLLQVLPLMMLGQWGIRRINRMVMGGQEVSKEVVEATALITTHFKARIGTLPLFTDAELQRLTMPILLLIGSKDVLRDAAKIIARLNPLVPNLTASVIPDGGHALLNTTGRVTAFLETAEHA